MGAGVVVSVEEWREGGGGGGGGGVAELRGEGGAWLSSCPILSGVDAEALLPLLMGEDDVLEVLLSGGVK